MKEFWNRRDLLECRGADMKFIVHMNLREPVDQGDI